MSFFFPYLYVYNPHWVPDHLMVKMFEEATVLKGSSVADQILGIFKDLP